MKTRSLLAALVLAAAPLVAPRAQLVFQPPIAADGGGNLIRSVLGDVDDDGLIDVVGTRFEIFLGSSTYLARGLGGGAFAAPQVIPEPGGAELVTRLADFDEDGHLDLVALGGFSAPANVVVRLGDGRGGFGAPLGINTNHVQPADADVGDFDADGHLDVAIYNANLHVSLGSLAVAFGHGDGSFEPTIDVVEIGLQVSDFLVVRSGDLNGDGFDDIVFSHTQPVALSDGRRGFTLAPCEGCFGFFVTDLELVDLNHDGRDDAVTPNEVLLAQPSGSFGPPQALLPGFVPLSVGAGDYDGDGNFDLAVGRGSSISVVDGTDFGDVVVRRGLGDGSFAPATVVVSHVSQPREIEVADLNLDGRPDLLVGKYQPAATSLATLLNHTYGPGSAFTDLGGALGGSNGYPIQLASGTLMAGQPFSFKLANGPPNGAAYHIVGVSQLAAPFKGGTMIPFPNLVNGPLPLNASGGINLAANWPAGGSGLTLWVQFWMPNGGGPAGFVASSGVRAQIP